jgi:hypothetical protein
MIAFLTYLACIWLGVGFGVFVTSLCVAARDGDDIVRRGRNRWHQ